MSEPGERLLPLLLGLLVLLALSLMGLRFCFLGRPPAPDDAPSAQVGD